MAEHMSKAKLAKQDVVASLVEKFKTCKSVIIVSYKGLTVAEDTELRNQFRKAGVEYKVHKNTLIKRAFNEIGQTAFDEFLNGTTSVAFCEADEVSAAKVVAEANKKLNGKIEAKCGFVDGAFADADMVKALADMPSKEVLLAKMLGSMNAPISGFVGVLAATLRSFVYAVKAVADKKASE